MFMKKMRKKAAYLSDGVEHGQMVQAPYYWLLFPLSFSNAAYFYRGLRTLTRRIEVEDLMGECS